MTIKIIEDQEPDVCLTAEEHARLMNEYTKFLMFYAGNPPSFEHWVKRKLRPKTYTNIPL